MPELYVSTKPQSQEPNQLDEGIDQYVRPIDSPPQFCLNGMAIEHKRPVFPFGLRGHVKVAERKLGAFGQHGE
jgi:hypothetical protein